MMNAPVGDDAVYETQKDHQKKKRRWLPFLFLLAATPPLLFVVWWVNREESEVSELRERILQADKSVLALEANYRNALQEGDAAVEQLDSVHTELGRRNAEMDDVSRRIRLLAGTGNSKLSVSENLHVLQERMTALKQEVNMLLLRIDSLSRNRLAAPAVVLRKTDTVYLPAPGDSARTATPPPAPVPVVSATVSDRLTITALQLSADDSLSQRQDVARKSAFPLPRVKLRFDVVDSSGVNAPKRLFALLVGPKSNENKNEAINKIYTADLSVPYNQAKPVQVTYTWELHTGFKPGMYKLELYNGGVKVGESGIRIKRGLRLQGYID